MTNITEEQVRSAFELGAKANFLVVARKEGLNEEAAVEAFLCALQQALKNSLDCDEIQRILEGSGKSNK